MLTVIYPGSASVYFRVLDSTGLNELHVDYGPNLVFVLTGSWPVTSSAIFFQGYDTGSLYPISSSWSLNVVSASRTISASYSYSASYAANASSLSQLNGTNPTYKIYVTASIPSQTFTSNDTVALAVITTSFARADGADFRVQRADPSTGLPSGSYLPTAVAISAQSGSNMTYQVWWTDTYVSNSVNKYIVTYGDSGATYMYLNQNQLALIKKRGTFTNGYAVYRDDSQADWYSSTNWGTIGVRISGLTGQDVASVSFPTATSYFYNGVTQVSFSANADCVFRYGNVGLGSVSPSSPDQWAFNNGDNRCDFCDMCANVDGWSMQYQSERPYNAPTQTTKFVVRYRNNGKFVLTIFDTSPGYQSAFGNNSFIQGYTGTSYWSYNQSNLITASNPASAMAVVLEPMAYAALSGSELPYP